MWSLQSPRKAISALWTFWILCFILSSLRFDVLLIDPIKPKEYETHYNQKVLGVGCWKSSFFAAVVSLEMPCVHCLSKGMFCLQTVLLTADLIIADLTGTERAGSEHVSLWDQPLSRVVQTGFPPMMMSSLTAARSAIVTQSINGLPSLLAEPMN